MTGKEALAIFKGWELSNPFEKEEVDLNSVRYANSQLNQEYHNIIKTIEKELDKLTKYKRALDIFKRLNGEHLPVYLGIGIISKEEYELLEELMKDE
mgnify:CR=1 FL=1